jgi:hypothetical protein
MSELGVWLSPLLLLPGTALLVASTSSRFNRIHDEIHHLVESGLGIGPALRSRLLKRAVLFRNALVCLYLSVSLFALAALLGGMTSSWPGLSLALLVGLTCAGVVVLLAAASLLVREATLSLEILREHFATAEWSEGGPKGGV